MFQLLPCSNCQRTFSLREDVSTDTFLKCPNCGNQFRLGDALDAFYAPWQIVAPSGATSAASLAALSDYQATADDDQALDLDSTIDSSDGQTDDGPGYFDTDRTIDEALDVTTSEVADLDSQSAEDFHYELGQESDDAQEQPLSLDDQPTAIADDESDQSTGQRKPMVKSRPRGTKGPSIWTLVQVMLGGAASIPVTLLLLWHVAGKDVMNAGPRIAQIAPWIVPSKFHHPSMPGVPSQTSRPPVTPPAVGESGFRNFDDVLPMDGDKLAAPEANPTDENANTEAPDKQPVETDTTMTELFAAVSSAKKKIGEYDTSETNGATIVSRLTSIMDDLSIISDHLAKVPADGDAVKLLRNDLRDLGRMITADPKLETAFKSGIRAQFNGAMKRTGQGRVFLGNVAELTESDAAWQLKYVEGQSGKIPGYNLEATIPKVVAEKLEQGSKVFVLGNLVPDDAETGNSAPKAVRIEATFLQTL